MSDIKQVRSIIAKAGTHIFHLSFTKKDGSKREMNCRLGVTSHLRGGDDSTYGREEFLNVFDMGVGEYRKINLNSVNSVKVGGKVYNV